MEMKSLWLDKTSITSSGNFNRSAEIKNLEGEMKTKVGRNQSCYNYWLAEQNGRHTEMATHSACIRDTPRRSATLV